jgi:hypothetical protein
MDARWMKLVSSTRPRFGLLGRFAQATTTRGAIVHTDAWNGYAGL